MILKLYITHEGGKWQVRSEAGKVLGEHDSKASAEKQLQAIEINKHKHSASYMMERNPDARQNTPGKPEPFAYLDDYPMKKGVNGVKFWDRNKK